LVSNSKNPHQAGIRHEPLSDLRNPDTTSNSCHSTLFSASRQVPMFHVKH
jgi:hypothetical protein